MLVDVFVAVLVAVLVAVAVGVLVEVLVAVLVAVFVAVAVDVLVAVFVSAAQTGTSHNHRWCYIPNTHNPPRRGGSDKSGVVFHLQVISRGSYESALVRGERITVGREI